jgi:membrane protease YdiL (CAAX protease family)
VYRQRSQLDDCFANDFKIVTHELQPRPDRPHEFSTAQHEVEYCRYCAAPLSAFYYFCLACGTPYKSVDNVLTPARPRELTGEELVAMKTPQVATLFWIYFSVVVGVAIFTYVLFRERRPDLQLFLNEVALLITTCVFGWIYRKSLSVQLKTFGFNHPIALVGLIALVPTLGLNYAYHSLFTEVFKVESVDPIKSLRDIGVREPTLIVMFCVFPAVLEEIAYRGLVQHWLETAIAPNKALVVASFLFAITHLSVISLPYLFLVGMLLGWVKQQTRSLYPSMLIHFLHNLVVIEFFPWV